MALDAGSIVYRTKFDDSGLKSGLKGSTATIKSTANKAGESVGNLNTKLTATQALSQNIGKAFGAFLGAGFIAKLGKDIFQAGAALETTRIQFEQLTGSAEGAEHMLDVLNKFADVTPNTNEEVLKAGKILATFNTNLSKDADALQATLLKVGNAAAFAGVPIDKMAETFGKATAEGKLTTDVLNQFTNAGVPLREELQRMFNVSSEGLREIVSGGKVTSQVLEDAFTNMSKEGGALHGAMERLSKSVSGLVSTFIGPLKQRFAEVALVIVSALKPALEGVIALMNFIGPAGQKIIVILGIMGSTFGALFLIIKSGFLGSKLAAKAFSKALIGTGIGAILVGIGLAVVVLMNYWDELSGTVKAFAVFFSGIFAPAIDYVKGLFKEFGDESSFLGQALSKVTSVISRLWDIWVKAWTIAIKVVGGVIAGVIAIKAAFAAAGIIAVITGIGAAIALVVVYWKELKEAAISVGSFLKDVFIGTVEGVIKVYDPLIKQLRRLGFILDWLKGIFFTVSDGLKSIWTDITEAFDKAFKGVSKTFGKVAKFIRKTVSTSLEWVKKLLLSMKFALKVAGVDVDKHIKTLNESLKKLWGPKEKNDVEQNGEDTGEAAGGGLAKGVCKSMKKDLKKCEEVTREWSRKTKEIIKTSTAGLQGTVSIFGDYAELEQKRNEQRFDAESESRRTALADRHEAELAQLREHEQAKTGVVLAESMQRMLAMDEEFQHTLEKEREAFEEHMEGVLDNNLTEEEERVNKAILEEDWKNEKERLEEEHINKKKAEEAKDKKAEEKAKKESEKKEKALLKKQKEEEIALEKELKMKKYEMEKKVFEQQKKQKIIEATLSTASGALNAYMAMQAIPGGVGVALGAINAGLASAFGLAKIAIIEAQPPPQKPQLAEGGLISGPGTGTSDSINANVSDGEFVIDAARTQRIQDFLDSNNMGKVVNITIEPGAINIRDDDDEDLDEKIADALARRFERVL